MKSLRVSQSLLFLSSHVLTLDWEYVSIKYSNLRQVHRQYDQAAVRSSYSDKFGISENWFVIQGEQLLDFRSTLFKIKITTCTPEIICPLPSIHNCIVWIVFGEIKIKDIFPTQIIWPPSQGRGQWQQGRSLNWIFDKKY